jgi:hypothetical protein
MKQFIHRSMAGFMALVVLMTTMSFTVNVHYCGDTLIDFSFIQQADTCGMEMTATIVDNENFSLSPKSCCTDHQVVKQGKDDLKITFDQLSLEQQFFIASFTYSYLNLFSGIHSQEIPYTDQPPPFIKRDVQVLHQTFLI